MTNLLNRHHNRRHYGNNFNTNSKDNSAFLWKSSSLQRSYYLASSALTFPYSPLRWLSSSSSTAMKMVSSNASAINIQQRCDTARIQSHSKCRQHQRQRFFSSYHEQPIKKKILFHSLGCPRNFVDTEVMLGLSIQSGYMEITSDADDADYVVVNTCGFLQSARDESLDVIQEIIDLKAKSNQDCKLLVTGCMVNIQKDFLLEEYPEIDSILGSGDIDKVMDAIEGLEKKDNEQQNHQAVVVQSSAKRKSFLEQGETPRFLATPSHYSYLKIAEGCRKRCAFCIIPKIKGRLQSKPIPQLVTEFHALQESGASEIILIAQDLGDYGKDFTSTTTTTGMNGTNAKSSSHLEQLLHQLLESTDDPNLWLRLLYLYPDEITPGLIDLMASDSRICRYLDMPIQHSSNKILKLMRRKTDLKQIETTIGTLRQRLPDIHIRTSLMVGFPGETSQDFEHLMEFVNRHRLENVGVFQYSNEDMAYSSKLPNHVPEEIKKERYQRLMELQYEIVRDRNQQFVDSNKQLEVVVEGLDDTGQHVVGRYYGQCPDIDGQVILYQEEDLVEEEAGSRSRRGRRRRQPTKRRPRQTSDERSKVLIPGERYTAEVTGYHEYDLIAKVL